MNKLQTHFWLYGIIPLLILYVFNMYFFQDVMNFGIPDCKLWFSNRDCPPLLLEQIDDAHRNFALMSLVIIFWTIWFIVKVFAFSKKETSSVTKMWMRSASIIIPFIFAILFPFLSVIFDVSDLMREYYKFWVYTLQYIGGNPGGFGMGYYILNILLFIFIQPYLIFRFYNLWKREKQNNAWMERE